jgi:hypothetical protein
MMNNCLLDAIAVSWSELITLSERYQGIVFLNLGEECIPHFILDIVLEKKKEKVVTTISPCKYFEMSCLMDKTHGDRKDLILLLKNMESDLHLRFMRWVGRQAPHTVLLLSDYIAESKAHGALSG